MVGAIALQEAVSFSDDAGTEELASHLTDVDLGDPPVVFLDVARWCIAHIGSS